MPEELCLNLLKIGAHFHWDDKVAKAFCTMS